MLLDETKEQEPDESDGKSEFSVLCSGLLKFGQEDLADVKSEIKKDPFLVQLQVEDDGGHRST